MTVTCSRRVRATLNSFARRLPAFIPVFAAVFLCGAFGSDVYAAWRERTTPQSVSDAELVGFTLSNYLQLETLHPAEAEGDLASVAFAGQNVGGLLNDEAALRQHVVAGGETLSTIAAQYNLHSGSIVLANKDLLDTELIHPGQVLFIPEQDASEEELDKEWQMRQEKNNQVAAKKQTEKKATVAAAVKASANTIKLRRPLSYTYKSQGFSLSHPGIDFAAPHGTPVYAVDDGCVVLAATGWNGGYGKTIILNIGGGYSIRYAHLSGFAKGLSSGDCYEAGDLIGYNGNTGRSTGPHLHFEVRLNGVPRDPGKFGL